MWDRHEHKHDREFTSVTCPKFWDRANVLMLVAAVAAIVYFTWVDHRNVIGDHRPVISEN